MARTKQTARKSTGGKAPRKNIFGGYQEEEEENIDLQSIWPTMESPSPMTPEQQELVDKEERYRELFGNNRSSPEISDPHVLLNDVFLNSFQFQDESPEEKAVPKILTKARKTGRKGACFNNQQQFLQNWKTFSNSILDGLDWNNVFAAGGSVLANVAAGASEESFGASDIDLFLYGFETDEEANKKLEHIYTVVTKHNKEAKIVRSFRAVTILGSYPDYRHVQIILKLYKSPAEVLLGFDVDCCTVGFDGKTVLAMDRCVRAVSKGYNLVNMNRRSLTYETRLRKYSKRGYAVAVPNLDKAQVDVSLFKQSATDVQGLAKLLIYEYYEINPPFYNPGKSYSTHKIIPRRYQYIGETINSDNIDIVRDITGEEDSDYAEFIPWGPSWYSHTILNMMDFKDRASAFSGRYTKRPGNKNNNNNNNKEKPPHVHSYVTGIKGVIEGSSSNFWCRYCKQNRPLEQGEDGKDVCGPLHWVKEYQAYQDIDKGFRRNFGGQTNQPVLQENWTEGVYAAGFQARDAPHPLKPAPKSPVKVSAPLVFASSPVRASVPDMFVSGGQHFESQNQMLRHQRDQFGAQKEGVSPFGDNVEAFGGRPSVDIFSQNVNAFGGGTLPFYSTVSSDTPSKSTTIRNLNSPSKSFTSTTAPVPSSFSSNNNNNNVKFATNNAGFSAGKPTITVAPAWWSLFNPGQGSATSQMSYTGQALLLVAALYRKGGITLQLKAELKDLIMDNDPLVRSVVEAFFIDNDIVELVDSFTRVLSIKRR